MTATLDAVIGLVKRDWVTYASYRAQLFTGIIAMVVSLTLYHYLSQLVHVSAFASPKAYFGFVVVGMVILQSLQSTLGVAGTIRGELVAGTFERLVLSPFGALPAMLSMMVFPFVVAVLDSIILLAIASIAFGVSIHWQTAPVALPLVFFGSGVFTVFGMLMAAMTVMFKRAVGGIGFLMTLISLSSGLFFPIVLLPHWVQWVAKVQPFTATVDLLRHTLVQTPLPQSAGLELARLGSFLVIFIPLTVLALRGSLRYAQRKGTIIEY
jgi:ABC-type multidrug transport system permease subunit